MTTHEIELKALMLASLDGDAASHRALLDRLSRRLRAYYKGKLVRFGRGAAEAEDLVQEAVLAIHFKRHTYDPTEPLTPWVHAIARYKLIDFLRRTRTSISDVPIEEGLSVAEAAERCGISEPGVKVNIHRGLKALTTLIVREKRT
jgi:RNA polymerase sigma-70 factor, ECF subfamily